MKLLLVCQFKKIFKMTLLKFTFVLSLVVIFLASESLAEETPCTQLARGTLMPKAMGLFGDRFLIITANETVFNLPSTHFDREIPHLLIDNDYTPELLNQTSVYPNDDFFLMTDSQNQTLLITRNFTDTQMCFSIYTLDQKNKQTDSCDSKQKNAGIIVSTFIPNLAFVSERIDELQYKIELAWQLNAHQNDTVLKFDFKRTDYPELGPFDSLPQTGFSLGIQKPLYLVFKEHILMFDNETTIESHWFPLDQFIKCRGGHSRIRSLLWLWIIIGVLGALVGTAMAIYFMYYK